MFRVGDVVRLKGQEVIMTVTDVSENETEVIWFSKDLIGHSFSFPNQALTYVKEETTDNQGIPWDLQTK